MPKQLVHEGRVFSLIPLQQDSGDNRTPAEITAAAFASGDWSSHYHDTARTLGSVKDDADGVVVSQDPTIYLGWSKEHPHDHESHSGPGDTGYVYFEIEFDEGYLERIMKWRQRARENAKDGNPEMPLKVIVMTDALSWRDLNVTAKALKQARDDAFGKPE